MMEILKKLVTNKTASYFMFKDRKAWHAAANLGPKVEHDLVTEQQSVFIWEERRYLANMKNNFNSNDDNNN